MTKPFTTLFWACVLAPMSLLGETTPQSGSERLTGPELIQQYVDSQTVDSELAYIELKTFETETPTDEVIKKRLLAVTQKNGEGYDYLVRLMSPDDVAGVSVLTNVDGDNKMQQYLYLPARGEPLRLEAAGRSGNFLGSDFAYEDLVREAPANYHYVRMDDALAQGEVCAVIDARPIDVDDSLYSRRLIYLDPESYEVRKIEFYGDDEETPVKELQAYEYRSPDVDGKTVRPRFAVMTNLETGTISVFKVLKSRLNLEIDEIIFTPENLSQMSEADANDLLDQVGASNL